MNKEFIQLDNQKGSFRFILLLNRECPYSTRMELLEAARDHGIASSAVYKILATFIEIGLITEKTTNTGQKITNLTSKGILLAQQIQEIIDLMEAFSHSLAHVRKVV